MTPVFGDVFTEMAVLLLLAAIIGAIGVRLRQPLIQVGCVLSVVRDKDTNLSLLHGLGDFGYQGRVVVTAHNPLDAQQLKQAGANEVLIPYDDAAATAVEKLFGQKVNNEHRDPSSA